MGRTIDMKFMRYINLFERICKVSTTNCFEYNNMIVFVIPQSLVSRALGKNAQNVKKMSETLRRRIKIIALPNSNREIDGFIKSLVEPVEFSSVEIKNKEVKISGDRQSKAILIGRNRIREKELFDILSKLFGIESLKIS